MRRKTWLVRLTDGEMLALTADAAETAGDLVLLYRSGEVVAVLHASELVFAACEPEEHTP